jgi:L-iditol 2-dehydrogenase
MRKAQFVGAGKVDIIECDTPTPSPEEVLVRVLRCALCGSDKRIWREGTANTPGHELVGIIEDPHSARNGERVLVYIPVFCGECRQCQAGRMHQCERTPQLVGWQRPGGYADYLTVPERVLLPIPEDVPTDLAPLLLDTIGTTAHGIRMAQKVTSPDTCLILGTGPIGIGALLVLRAMGIDHVACFDPAETRQQFAFSSGAQPLQEAEQYDLVIEASGLAQVRTEALHRTASGGCAIFFGESSLPFILEPSVQLRRKDFYVLRSFYFPISDLERNIPLLLGHQEAFSRMVDQVVQLEQLEATFRQFANGKLMKPIVSMEL